VKNIFYIVLLVGISITTTACNGKENIGVAQADQTAMPPSSSAVDSQLPDGTSGLVLETHDASGYTYVLVDSGTEKVWAAAPAFSVAVGDQVIVPAGITMYNYHSKTLNRDFKSIYFVETILNASDPAFEEEQQLPLEHPPITIDAAAQIDLSDIARADNGQTIAEIYAAKQQLEDKKVILRGKIVKFSPNIMGTNWLHVQDGSGSAEDATNDLTVTSDTEVGIGDTVIVQGVLTLDRDFGFGYNYALIIEGAKVTVE
jgi:hypothetical protein